WRRRDRSAVSAFAGLIATLRLLTRSASLDRDTLHSDRRLGGFRQRDMEHAFLERSAHFVFVHIDRQRDLALEPPIEPLAHAARRVLAFSFLLTANAQHAVVQ